MPTRPAASADLDLYAVKEGKGRSCSLARPSSPAGLFHLPWHCRRAVWHQYSLSDPQNRQKEWHWEGQSNALVSINAHGEP